MTSEVAVAAVDLGASSGRVMVGRVGERRLTLEEAHRFPNRPVQLGGTLHWDILSLYAEVLDGLRAAAGTANLAGVGIDSWAVDYGLVDATGALLGNPIHYRDSRTAGVLERVVAQVPEQELYATTGLQQLPFNTLYQLVSALGTTALNTAQTLLLIPDLLAYWLTEQVGAEATNASTTQLYDVRRRIWAVDLADRLGLPAQILPPIREPGQLIGALHSQVADDIGVPNGVPVIAVGSHDTASAVVGVPALDDRFAYISCGTWSLVGVELSAPVLSEDARLANFTNEGGVDGTIRFLRNVMGLWLLQESQRAWTSAGVTTDLPTLLADAGRVSPFTAVVDPDDPSFLPPGDMPPRIADACRATGQPPPSSPAETVRCIIDSLALAHRRTVREAQELSGRVVDVVHIVGGGARNALLCQLTADACGLPVLAGPVEATALGNVVVQARTLGAPLPDLTAMRGLLRETQELRRYEPRGDVAAWDATESRVYGMRTGVGTDRA
ncbi:MAG TPA: rhamnulokinase family protein [Jiangellaceae bacterium]|nr:rhamnulokinase family protein [Jiangellaceae bacterium]